MESYLRWGLLVTGIIIFVLISFDAWNRWRQLKAMRNQNVDDQPAPSSEEVNQLLGLTTANSESEEKNVLDISEDDIDDVMTPTLNISEDASVPSEVLTPTNNYDLAQDLLIIYVLAKPGCRFGSYDLLQSILATGMQFGDMNIFHYHLPAALGRAKLFSMASATEPGEFNLDKIGHFYCRGLTLFTNLKQVPNAKQAFENMLRVAEQLSDDLDGVLYADRKTPLTTETLQLYWTKVYRYQYEPEY